MNLKALRTRPGRAAGESPCFEDLVAELGDVSLADRDRVGTKSAVLGELTRAGFDVPAGFILTTEAFRIFMQGIGRDYEGPQAGLERAAVPEIVAAALASALAGLGDGPVAVRSSAVGEDLDNASFAGVYDTVLGIRGVEAVARAVQRCWASAYGERAAVYRAMKGMDSEPRMAVLVQRLIDAEASGVAFTADPLTGDTSVTLISAVPGLGEAMVSGWETPEEWRVEGNQAMCEAPYEAVLDVDRVLCIAEAAKRIEERLGGPQDIEWAISEGCLYVLQARPITAL